MSLSVIISNCLVYLCILTWSQNVFYSWFYCWSRSKQGLPISFGCYIFKSLIFTGGSTVSSFLFFSSCWSIFKGTSNYTWIWSLPLCVVTSHQWTPHCQEWEKAPFHQGCGLLIKSLLIWTSTSPHLLFITHPWLVEETGSVVQVYVLSLCLQCHMMLLGYQWYPNHGLSPPLLTHGSCFTPRPTAWTCWRAQPSDGRTTPELDSN